MCVAPGVLANGQKIGCRKCWQCKEVRINDWAGRCIAESKTSVASHFVTLTYGRDQQYGSVDHERARVLTYSDVQKFIKLLRWHKFPLKYIAVGEYGTEKGRAHWHLLIYWKDKVPEFNMNVREDFPHWPHGFVQWEEITSRSVRYICKYLNKNEDDDTAQSYLAMSKKPPLGHEYFTDRAKQYVRQGLAPQDLAYSWPDVVNKKGKVVRFMMGATTAINFIRTYVDYWIEVHGNDHYPNSDLVDEYRDRQTRKEETDMTYEELNDPAFIAEEKERLYKARSKAEFPWVRPPGNNEIEWSDTHNAFYSWENGTKWWWSFDKNGDREWHTKIVSEKEGERREPKKDGKAYAKRSESSGPRNQNSTQKEELQRLANRPLDHTGSTLKRHGRPST